METHLHQSALAFKKELNAGLARRFLFSNFPGLIVMQLYMEWANKNRAGPITKAAMREMLQIIKADERPTGKNFPLENPWAEFLYRYAATVSDLLWNVIEEHNRVQIVQLEEVFGSLLTDEHANSLLSLFSVMCYLLTEHSCLVCYLRRKYYTSRGVIANNFIANR